LQHLAADVGKEYALIDSTFVHALPGPPRFSEPEARMQYQRG
jgi:hypothetical protein